MLLGLCTKGDGCSLPAAGTLCSERLSHDERGTE